MEKHPCLCLRRVIKKDNIFRNRTVEPIMKYGASSHYLKMQVNLCNHLILEAGMSIIENALSDVTFQEEQSQHSINKE